MASFPFKLEIVEPFGRQSTTTKFASPSADNKSRAYRILVSKTSACMRSRA